MRKYIISEKQAKRLMNYLLHEQTPPPVATGDEEIPADASTDTATDDAVDTTTPDAAAPATDTPTDTPTDMTPDGADMSASGGGEGGAGSMGGGSPFDSASANADSNSKVTKWESGASRGKANPLQGNGPWESGASRGPGNQVGNTKWADTVPITRGKANTLFENKKKKKK